MGKAKKKPPSEAAQKISKGGLFQFTSFRTEEFIAAVKPYWRSWTNAEKQELLRIPVAEALERAKGEQRKMSEVPDDTYKKIWGYAVAAPLDGNLIRAKDFLQSGWPLREWRWSQDLDAKAFCCPRSFWTYAEHDCIEASLLEHLPWNNSEDDEFDVLLRLEDFLGRLYEKIQETQLDRMVAEALNSEFRCIGGLKENNRVWQEGIIMNILKDLQQSPYQMLYHHLQGCLEKAVKEERLPQSKLGLQFDIHSATGFLQELPDDCIDRLAEWLISKIDEFRSMAGRLQEGEWEADPEPFALRYNDSDGEFFIVTAAWLQHLEVSKMDESRLPGGGKFVPGLDLDETGLQLEWIFGSVISNHTAQMKQALQPAGLELYTLRDALDAFEDALKSQQACKHARDAARQVAFEILQHRKALPGFLELYPDMYTVQQERCSEDDRELPDDVLLFMLSRELNILTAKLSATQIAGARAALTPTGFREIIAEVSHYANSLTFERWRGRYRAPSNKFQGPKVVDLKEVFQEHQTERNQGTHPVRIADWADWVRATRGYLEAVVRAQDKEEQPARNGGGNIGKNPIVHDEEAGFKALANLLLGPPPPPAKLTPTQMQWHKDLRNQFNKVIRPRLCSEKDGVEALTAISKEIKYLEAMIENGHASLSLLAKQFENVAYSDMSAKLGHTLIPMFAERVHRFAKDQNRMQAEKAKQDLFQEEQAKVEKEEQKKAKKLRQKKAKERKLEERTASGAAGNGTVTSKEEDQAGELTLPERPTSPSLGEEEPESKIEEEEGRPESQDGEVLRLFEHPDRHKELVSGPLDPLLESHDAFVVVQKKSRRLKDHPLPRRQSHPCAGDSMCNDSEDGVAPLLPMPMSNSHVPSKRPVRPRPPVQ